MASTGSMGSLNTALLDMIRTKPSITAQGRSTRVHPSVSEHMWFNDKHPIQCRMKANTIANGGLR